MKQQRILSLPRQQHGAVLIVSMLLLLVVTLLALGASQSTRLQERMAGNQRNFDLALQAAEAGLRGGERFVDADSMPEAVSPCAAVPCTTKVYERGYLAKTVDYEEQAFESNEWWQERAQPYDAAGATVIGGLGLADAEPMFYIEEVEEVPDALSIPPTGPPPSRVFYRIVARGKGGTDNANVVLHSTYVRRFN